MTTDFDLARFVAAQEISYCSALAELREGEKRTHWMWYIFPQIAGLGRSAMATRYAIRSLDEALAYLGHPLLGPRYRECLAAVDAHAGRSALQIFGPIDALKFHSSLTLFAEAGEPLAESMLGRWFHGERDDSTLALLAARG